MQEFSSWTSHICILMTKSDPLPSLKHSESSIITRTFTMILMPRHEGYSFLTYMFAIFSWFSWFRGRKWVFQSVGRLRVSSLTPESIITPSVKATPWHHVHTTAEWSQYGPAIMRQWGDSKSWNSNTRMLHASPACCTMKILNQQFFVRFEQLNTRNDLFYINWCLVVFLL